MNIKDLLSHYKYLHKDTWDLFDFEIESNENKIYLDELKSGKYLTNQKTDRDQVNFISLITNNLPSFKKYKEQNDLSYLFNKQMIFELLVYHIGMELSKINFYKRLCSFIRLLYIKNKYEKTETITNYLKIINILSKEIIKENEEQKLNDLEQTTFFDYQILIDKQNELLNQITTDYKTNQDLILLSLYTLIPPNRNEINQLMLIKDEIENDGKNDYILCNEQENKIILNKEKKGHKGIIIELPEELTKIITESYEKYPRKYLLTNYNDKTKKISYDSIYKRFRNLFPENKISINAIRSSYLSYRNKLGISIAEKKKLAILMRTSVNTIDNNYIKIVE